MAPKGMKRPAAVSEAAAKKAKIGKMCTAIADAIETTDTLPDSVTEMLGSISKSAMSEYKDQRHPFQVKIVDMVKTTLAGIQASYQKEIDAEQAKVSGAEAEKARRDTVAEEATKVLDGKKEAAKAKKDALTEATAAKKAAEEALKAAEKAQKTGDADLLATGTKKEHLEQLKSEMYTPLKEGTTEGSAGKATATKLVSILQKEFGFDKTMLNTLPPALAKPAAERGHFDGLVLTQFEEECGKRLAEFSETLAQGEPAKAARAAAVTAAEAALAASAEKLTAASAEKTAADTEEKEAEKVLKEAAKHVKDFAKDFSAATSALEEATGAMTTFLEGAMAAFTELSERETPPPEPEVPAEEAPAPAAPEPAA
eukprot:gnl/TRDRNA2_/TRDRNA2_171891_c0_seq8.p1 gnl/TRDRNA2_/TRDRNA2_171891_c0~~gnl/TRDRNA2_/TRDRNA2_171891_c0_seq8.p1  ORF type:complete len:398 (+),score=150.24 gnl/TRDRNA2_/TRDRNA2_171891_c0_seq8:86-1195(+)